MFTKLNLSFFILINFLVTINCLCDDWEPFNKEKCFKIIETTQLKSFDESVDVCRAIRNSSLPIIRTEDEHQFLVKLLFEHNATIDNAWLGLRRNRITQQFQWFDGNHLSFTSWGKDNPSNKPGRDCVQLLPDGEWRNFYCNKRNVVVCQRLPFFTDEEWQTMVIEVRASVKQSEKRMQDKMSLASDNLNRAEIEFQQRLMKYDLKHQQELEVVNKKLKQVELELQQKLNQVERQSRIPIGFIYIQLPNQSEPKILFPGEWADVSQLYSGLFFRTVGGNSLPFGKIQEEASPRIVEANSSYCKKPSGVELQTQTKLFDENKDGLSVWSDKFYVGDDVREKIIGVERYEMYANFRMSLAEVRPKNTAVRIWKKVK